MSFEERSFLRWLFELSGLDVSAYRPQTLARRLPACVRALQAPSLRAARRVLEESPHLRPVALCSLLVGTTSFFRDRWVFNALAAQVLPRIVASQRRPAVWSAGCSDGAELYSIAIVLSELGLLGRCRLIGTDCRTEPIERARAGRYPAHALRGVRPELLHKYFLPDSPDAPCGRSEDAAWHVHPELRDAAEWQRADLLRGAPADQPDGGWDLILCRNVAIYLEPTACAALWTRMHRALRPGGVLVTGKAERPAVPGLRAVGPCLFRREDPSRRRRLRSPNRTGRGAGG